MKKLLLLLAGISCTLLAWSQEAEAPREKGETQFGVRLGYTLELPSQNFYNGEEFSLFEAGHRFSYGAYINIPLDWNIQFVPFFGLDQNFWPKSLGYAQDCALDSFPTFISTSDTVPGRNFRFNNLVFEPAIKVWIPRAKIHVKFQAHLTYSIRARVENYPFACGISGGQNWLDYEGDALRNHNRFNLGFGASILKEVMIGERTGISLEPGARVMLTPLLQIQDSNPNGPYFTLYPWGIYLNIGVFR